MDTNSSSSEDDNEYSIIYTTDTEEEDTDEENTNNVSTVLDSTKTPSAPNHENRKDVGSKNLWQKLLQREHNLSINWIQSHVFTNRVTLCLRDIIPFNQVAGHIFMGLTVCGSFMLSYKIRQIETGNPYLYKQDLRYTLYFWRFHINNPQKKMRIYHHRCLFDNHGISGPLEVQMAQWKRNAPHVLVVHGAADLDYEDSFITYIKVPRLGCSDCRRLRESEQESTMFESNSLCLKCNLTTHIKYSKAESDRNFNPYINLLYPNRILNISNGIMHMLSIDIESPPAATTVLAICSSPIISSQTDQYDTTSQDGSAVSKISSALGAPSPLVNVSEMGCANTRMNSATSEVNIGCDSSTNVSATVPNANSNYNNKNNIVASIIADFSDIETDVVPQQSSTTTKATGATSVANISNNNNLNYSNNNNNNNNNNSNNINNNNNNNNNSMVNYANNHKGKIVNCKLHEEQLIFNCVTSSTNSRSSSSNSSISNSSKSSSSNNTCSTASSTYRSTAVNRDTLSSENQFKDMGGTKDTSTNTVNSSSSSTISSLIQHRGKRHARIVTKSYRYGIISVDMQGAVSTTTNFGNGSNNNNSSSGSSGDKSNAYEFSEDNEKCEKISTLRKRRLADKKYEFSEDNSENIIPFTKVRLASKTAGQSALFSGNNSPSSTNLDYCPATPGSLPPPSSPCPSPVSNIGVMHSPSRHQFMSSYVAAARSPQPHLSPATQYMLSFKPLGTLSPIQLSSVAKRNYLDGSISPNSSAPFLSPRRDYIVVSEVPLPVSAMPEKPVCTKKFKRRYVEEDDAASVITSEDDDCISPGYHTLLPCEVHGTCYSEMQMISKASYQQIRCSSVVVTQHSFDLETFTYYVLNTICQKNNRVYDVIYDWACEPIYVCPVSCSVIGLLMAHFYARDVELSKTGRCASCAREMGCIFHRRPYECRILFSWNMESGECEVLDYGEMTEKKQFPNPSKTATLMTRDADLTNTARLAAAELEAVLNKTQSYRCNLKIMDSNIRRSKRTIIENDHGVEFHLTRTKSE